MNVRKSSYDKDVHLTHPATLAQLLSTDVRLLPWSSIDLKAILRHQLEVPMAAELGALLPAGPAKARTFGELFAMEKPPLDYLKAAKEFFKESRVGGESPIPAEVATALYFAAVLAARLRCNAVISSLGTRKLTSAVEWGLAVSWMCEPLESIFRQSKRLLKRRPTSP